MKDSYDKDPFAEYDKYWDDLDKIEKQDEQKEEYRFHPEKMEDQKPTEFDFKKILPIIFSIGLFLFIVIPSSSNSGVTFTPFIILIVFGVIISNISKKNKR